MMSSASVSSEADGAGSTSTAEVLSTAVAGVVNGRGRPVTLVREEGQVSRPMIEKREASLSVKEQRSKAVDFSSKAEPVTPYQATAFPCAGASPDAPDDEGRREGESARPPRRRKGIERRVLWGEGGTKTTERAVKT